MKPFQTSCKKEKEYHFESRAKENRSYRVIKNSKPRADKEAEHRFVKNLKPQAEEDRSISESR